jgi:predicted MPP superfamily phosphohydrolase
MLERFLIGMAIVVMVFFLLESLTYRAIWKAYSGQPWWPTARMVWWGGHGLLWAAFLAAVVLWPSWRETHPALLRAILSITFAVSIPKVFVAAVQLLDELRALGAWTWLKVSGQSTAGAMARGSFLNHLAQGAGVLAFFGMAYGILRGKYAYKLRELVVAHPNVPKAFDGLRVVQLSDAHLGSFEGTPEPVLTALKKVNELKPDVILFTGDLVNDWADEAEPWVESFAALEAPMGKFSIMGNHDYADYGPHDKEERLGSIAKLKSLQAQMGFQMLDNSHVLWEKEGDAMVLAGVENWGRGFRQSGDLSQALQGSDAANRFTVLMSHDPTHFESMVMDNKAPVELTLSGHTHGMQLGIEIPWLGIQWSPSSFRYKRWGGLYLEGKQYLHVNRGFGVLGFPGRVGMPPEITVLTLVQGEARA